MTGITEIVLAKEHRHYERYMHMYKPTHMIIKLVKQHLPVQKDVHVNRVQWTPLLIDLASEKVATQSQQQ